MAFRVTYTNHPFREEKTFSCGRPHGQHREGDLDRAIATARRRAKQTDSFDIDQLNEQGEWVRVVTRGKHVGK